MSRVHLEADIPADLPEAERVERFATVIDAGLKTVAADPEMRLQMILGEFASEYRELCRRLAMELRKDEAKAPGLRALSEKTAFENPDTMMHRHRLLLSAEAVSRQHMLEEALGILLGLEHEDTKASPPPKASEL